MFFHQDGDCEVYLVPHRGTHTEGEKWKAIYTHRRLHRLLVIGAQVRRETTPNLVKVYSLRCTTRTFQRSLRADLSSYDKKGYNDNLAVSPPMVQYLRFALGQKLLYGGS